MAKLQKHRDKRCVFRQVFTDEVAVRKNGGKLPSTTSYYSFVNGCYRFNNSSLSSIYYKEYIKPTTTKPITVRLKLRKWVNPGTGSKYIVTLGTSGCSFTTGTFSLPSHTITSYQDGVLNSSITIKDNTELVVIITPNNNNIKVFDTVYIACASNLYGQIGDTGTELELFEIYNYALSASEVSQLYKNSLYLNPKPKLSKPIFDLNFTNGLIEESTGKTLTLTNPTIIKKEIPCLLGTNTNHIRVPVDIRNYDTYTFNIWVNFTNLDSGNQSNPISSNNDQFSLNYLKTSNLIRWTTNSFTNIASATFKPISIWHMVTVSTNNNLTTFYIDGIQTGTINQSTPKSGITVDYIQIGNSRAAKTPIAKVTMFDNILTPDQIANIYSYEKTLFGL